MPAGRTIALCDHVNIVGVVMVARRKNWASVANYVKRILRLKKRDLEVAEHVSVSA